jgi:ABC-type transport system involved in cytochrome c biogenesis permease subunit
MSRWCGLGLGLPRSRFLFELTSRARYYLLAAAPLSVVCLILADSLPAVLDPSIAPLVPVLRDNFWLSIHVPTIALSYASFALALGLAMWPWSTILFTPNAKQRIRTLSQLNYRVLQVGVLLLTAGIILGGIWAHFSWGRFWGWDPKETWALIALALLPGAPPRSAGGLDWRLWHQRGQRCVLQCGADGLVRRQLCAGHGPAQLWLWYGRV